MKSRHSNLSNPASEPAKAPVTVTCTVHYDPGYAAFPKRKFQEWLESLPEEARITFQGTTSGKPHFTATWEETR